MTTKSICLEKVARIKWYTTETHAKRKPSMLLSINNFI